MNRGTTKKKSTKTGLKNWPKSTPTSVVSQDRVINQDLGDELLLKLFRTGMPMVPDPEPWVDPKK